MKNLLQLHFYAEKEGKKHASLWVNLLCGSLAIYSLLRPGKLNQSCGSNPPTAAFFRLLCFVHLPQKVRGIFALRERRLELPRRLTHAPQTCLSTCSSTLANCFFSKARVIITEKTRMSRTNFKISCLSDIHNCIGYAQQQRGKHKLAADARLNKVIAVKIRIVAMQ